MSATRRMATICFRRFPIAETHRQQLRLQAESRAFRRESRPSEDGPRQPGLLRAGSLERDIQPAEDLAPTYGCRHRVRRGRNVVRRRDGMSDALGRHTYSSTPRGALERAARLERRLRYDRWRPTLFTNYPTTPIRRGRRGRSRELFAGALLPFRRIRMTQTLMAGFDADRQTVALPARAASPGTAAICGRFERAGYDSRRTFGYSISPRKASPWRRP